MIKKLNLKILTKKIKIATFNLVVISCEIDLKNLRNTIFTSRIVEHIF